MNLLLYILLAFVGFIGLNDELKSFKSNKALFSLFSLLFVLIACLRIDSNLFLGDLSYYIDYFKDDSETYFEPGYALLTQIVKIVFGKNEYALVIVISLWVIFFVIFASNICVASMRNNNIYLPCRKTSYYYTLFYFVCFYWGCFFVWQTFRIGLATSILFCASALAINKKMKLSLLVALISIFFHTSCFIFVLGIIVLCFVNMPSFKQYVVWFILIIVFRLVSFFTFSIGGVLESIILMDDMFSHYSYYLTAEDIDSGFSIQDVIYHVFGLIMLRGNLRDPRYNRAVMIYFLGLTAGVIFMGSGITMRIQWLFLSMVVFPLYYFVLDKSFSFSCKLRLIVAYTIIEEALAIRQFGWYI